MAVKQGKICSCCGEFISLKYFSKDAHTKDGYRTTCKLCDKKSQKRSRAKMVYIHVEQKQCTECGKVKAISEFGVDKTKKDGHRSYCLKCMGLQQKLRRRIKLLKQPTSKL